jgi:serine/threonine-protein kinase HipA
VSALEAIAAAAATTHTREGLQFLQDLVPARVSDLLQGGTARRELR